MSYLWDNLKKEFEDFGFDGYKTEETDNGNRVVARWANNRHFFFLLENEEKCCRLEFVIEYGNHHKSYIEKAAEKINIRNFHNYIHYTDSHWVWRQRITSCEELKSDLTVFFDIIKPILDSEISDQELDAPVKSCCLTAKELLKWNIRIPDYQRPYSWREKNVRDFLVDISMWQQDENKKGIPYHLGTIILKEQTESEVDYYDVIDGQQRLTTLAVIAYLQDNADIPLLNSSKYYGEVEIQTILRARNYIRNFENKINFEQIELSVVVLSKDQSEDLAYTFFSNSNSTGKHLSDYDLLKTHHLRYISDGASAERFSTRWHNLEKSGKQNEVLQSMMYRLRKWINNENFPVDANNRESRDIFDHYKSVDLLREFPSGSQLQFRFNSLLSGGKEFFDYTEYYRKKYIEFLQFKEIESLTQNLSWHSNGVIYSGIKAIAFLFFCKFGDMYLKEAVYLLAYRLSELRNKSRVMCKYLSDEPIFRDSARLLDQVTSESQFFALLGDVKKRYAETNRGNAALRYWESLHTLMSLLEDQHLAVANINIKSGK